MRGIPKGVIAIAVAIVVSGFVFYHYFTETLSGVRREATTELVLPPPVANRATDATVKEVSATTSYEVPGDKIDTLKFVVKLDAMGAIEQMTTLDPETGEIPEKKKEFNDQVNVILKGKKLAELTKIDKVGKSTLTTDAFNSVIDELKAQL